MDFQKAVDLINGSKNILLTAHIGPDGDACGSIVAMADAITALGKNPEVLLLSESPKWYDFLFSKKPAVLNSDVTVDDLKTGWLDKFDLVILIDVNSSNQLSDFSEFLTKGTQKVLVLDHHVTNDSLGDVELLDTSAAATGVIVFELLKYAGWQITEKIAEAIFVAIATDTGWFEFANTDSRVLNSCAELLDAGVDSAKIYHQLYQNFTPQRFNLMIAMLNTLELHFDGRYAAQYLRKEDFVKTGADYKDTETLIGECQKINSVVVSVLFVELADGIIRCSLRSGGVVDVRKVAQKFNGGGHTNASGVRLQGPLEEAMKTLKAEIEKQL